VKYLDVPLQHASRSVLARMKRGSHGGVFLKMIERIRNTIPGVWLRTSLIVGFPGETKQDFQELCSFVRDAEFDWLGVFSYSDEDAAISSNYGAKVDAETIASRKDTLMSIQRKISVRRLRGRIGNRMRALVEGTSAENELLLEARLEGMAPEIDGKIYIVDVLGPDGAPAKAIPPAGTMVEVEITDAQEYDLVGRVVNYVPALGARPEPQAPLVQRPFAHRPSAGPLMTILPSP
jgi:ribosomal protein S12 methylthiotransferase